MICCHSIPISILHSSINSVSLCQLVYYFFISILHSSINRSAYNDGNDISEISILHSSINRGGDHGCGLSFGIIFQFYIVALIVTSRKTPTTWKGFQFYIVALIATKYVASFIDYLISILHSSINRLNICTICVNKIISILHSSINRSSRCY